MFFCCREQKLEKTETEEGGALSIFALEEMNDDDEERCNTCEYGRGGEQSPSLHRHSTKKERKKKEVTFFASPLNNP